MGEAKTYHTLIHAGKISLGEFLAPLLLTGLQGLQWQAWLNGDLLGLALIACHEGFFLQVQVWCGPTLMQNMLVAAPLICGTLHIDMDAMPDTSLVRVTIYIPGGNTLISSRELSVTCQRSMMETCALEELRSHWRPASSRISGNPGASCSHMECAVSYFEQGEDGPGL